MSYIDVSMLHLYIPCVRAQLLLDKAVHMTYNINDIKVSHDFIQSLYY